MSDPDTMDDALAQARGEVSVLVAAGGGVPDARAEGALAAAGLELTLVNIRLTDNDPRPVMSARFELVHGPSREGRIVEVFVAAPSRQPSAVEVEQAKITARHQMLQELVGASARDAKARAGRPTIELPDID